MYSIMIHEQNKSMCCRMLYSRADLWLGRSKIRLCASKHYDIGVFSD